MKSRAKRARRKSPECLAAKATQHLSSRRRCLSRANPLWSYRGSRVGCKSLALADSRPATTGDGKRQLLHHHPERQDHLAVDFVEHLRQAGVDRGEPAENSFVAGELFETRTCVNEIANRQ